jgi:hypothetical protein
MALSIKLQNSANIATVIASIVAIITFYYGYQQFQETQQATRENLILQKDALNQERESRAVELFIKYNELMKESVANFANVNKDNQFWRDNLAIGIAESIFKLRETDEGWIQTVSWMLTNHQAYFNKIGLNCKTYDPDFIKLITKVYNRDFCAGQ